MKLYLAVIVTFGMFSNMIQCVSGVTSKTAPPEISFGCDDQGKITNVFDPYQKNDTIVLINDDQNNTMCHINNPGCLGKANKIHVMYSEGNKNIKIVEGKSPQYYELECTPESYAVMVTAKPFSISPTTQQYAIQKHDNKHGTIQLELNGPGGNQLPALIKIGSSLQLSITAPANTIVSPLNCTAYDAHNKTNTYLIWKNCSSQDTAILEKSDWTKTVNASNSINIEMFAFRFIGSPSVIIECAATICPGDIDACKQIKTWCNGANISGRRRRSAGINTKDVDKYQEESASVSFTVGNNYEGINKSTDVSSSIIMNLSAFLVAIQVVKKLC